LPSANARQQFLAGGIKCGERRLPGVAHFVPYIDPVLVTAILWQRCRHASSPSLVFPSGNYQRTTIAMPRGLSEAPASATKEFCESGNGKRARLPHDL